MKPEDVKGIQRWRKRGHYSELRLVAVLQSYGFEAVRVPVSNPSLNPLPDVIARKGMNVYAFEVKNANYYAYFPKQQIIKLFQFLDKFIPLPNNYRHAVLCAHLKKRLIFQELSWNDYTHNGFADKLSLNKRQHGNWNFKKVT